MNIFDPLSIIIKLAILSKKPRGTKISIKNYILLIQPPSYFQGFIRYINDDNKFDLKNLINPIKLACELYLNKKIHNLVLLFRLAQNGLLVLINTYTDLIIIHLLKYAFMIIEININNFNKHQILLKSKSNISTLCSNINTLTKSLSNNSLFPQDESFFNKNIESKISSFNKISRNSSLNSINPSLSRNSSLNNISRSPSLNNISRSPSLNYQSKSPSLNCQSKSPSLNCQSKSPSLNNMSRNSSIDKIEKTDDYFNDNINKIIFRYGATGYFNFNFENDKSTKIYDEIIKNISNINNLNESIKNNNIFIIEDNYNNILLNDFLLLWTDEKINNIIDNFINYYIDKEKIYIFKIEKYMKDIDDDIINIILSKNLRLKI